MQRLNNIERQLHRDEIEDLRCRPDDRIDKSLVAGDAPAPSFAVNGKQRLSRAPKTTLNTVTAWWDASQIYGFNETSQRRVKRDPRDPAKLLLEAPGASATGQSGLSPGSRSFRSAKPPVDRSGSRGFSR